MKRWLWYLVAVAAVALLSGKPSAGQDIGKLQPVQTVYLTASDEMVLLQTDTGDWGSGETLADAVQDMKMSAVGEVFLETADYLLVSPQCVGMIPTVMEHLHPSCSVCVAEGKPDLEQVGAFLEHHAPRMTLTRYRAGERGLQTLITQEGRMELVS